MWKQHIIANYKNSNLSKVNKPKSKNDFMEKQMKKNEIIQRRKSNE